METQLEDTLSPGKLVREPPDPIRRLLTAEIQPGEVIVSLLETATEEQLRSGSTKIWVALSDRRALVLAAVAVEDTRVQEVPTEQVSHKGRLGRDQITFGEQTFKCPLLRGGSEFKQMAKLAAAPPVERLREAASLRLKEDEPAAAATLAAAGLELETEGGLLALRIKALVALDGFAELGPALTSLVAVDPELGRWEEVGEALRSSPKALWMLYQAADTGGVAPTLRARLSSLRTSRPNHPLTAELAVRMDADEGLSEEGLTRAVGWLEEGAIDAETFLSASATLAQAGLDSEPLHRRKAMALGDLGRLDEALAAVGVALDRSRTVEALRVRADLLVRSARAPEAAEPLEELLSLGEDDHWIRSKLGDSYEAQGRLDDAVTAREVGLEHLLSAGGNAEASSKERRALARLHRSASEAADAEEKDLRATCAELLEAGHDWAARLSSTPPMVLSGARLDATVELVVARRLTVGDLCAGLSFEEAVLDGKNDPKPQPAAPRLLEGGVAGNWPVDEEDGAGVHASKKSARVRYAVGAQVDLDLPPILERGRHQCPVVIEVPTDTRPSYSGDKVLAKLSVEISPLLARFEVPSSPCHHGGAALHAEEREGSGKLPIKVAIADSSWSFGGEGTVRLAAGLTGNRLPDRVEAALVATERMRPPHKGERVVETLVWTFPIFRYERDEEHLERSLTLQLPERGNATGFWTWFEHVWSVRVRLLRKDKREATAEVPILLRFPPLERTEEVPTPDVAPEPTRADPTVVTPPAEGIPDDDRTVEVDFDGDESPDEAPSPAGSTPPGTDWGQG